MKTYRVDLHGMTVIESKIELNHILDSISWDYTDVLVVHGYHSHILMDFVRNEYKHKRIKKLEYSLNPGDTSFILKTKKEFESGKEYIEEKGRKYIFTSEKLGFARWEQGDLKLARKLWLNRDVCEYLDVDGAYSVEEVKAKFREELTNEEKYHTQHWLLFDNTKRHFIGCCGLGDNKGNTRNYELEIYLLPQYWNKGIGKEAVKRTLEYAFEDLEARSIMVKYHPENTAMDKIVTECGFQLFDEQYSPIKKVFMKHCVLNED